MIAAWLQLKFMRKTYTLDLFHCNLRQLGNVRFRMALTEIKGDWKWIKETFGVRSHEYKKRSNTITVVARKETFMRGLPVRHTCAIGPGLSSGLLECTFL